MPNFKKITVKCDDCAKDFETSIAVDDNGIAIGGKPMICRECWGTQRDKGRDLELRKELDDIRKEQFAVWRRDCNLQGVFVKKTFANFNSKLQPVAFKILKEWDFGKSLVLSSPDTYGLGKTHLICALVNRLVENEMTADIIGDITKVVHKYQCPVYITNEIKIMARIRATFENQDKIESEESIYRQLCKVPLLIIDDVGKVRPRDYSFLQGVYFRIINERYVNEKDIMITTNLSFKELEEHIGGACADRLREMCGKDGLITMTGKSYRRK